MKDSMEHNKVSREIRTAPKDLAKVYERVYCNTSHSHTFTVLLNFQLQNARFSSFSTDISLIPTRILLV